jgi:hypothetical protein
VGECWRWSAVVGQTERVARAREWDGAPAGGRAAKRGRLWASAGGGSSSLGRWRGVGAAGFIARDVDLSYEKPSTKKRYLEYLSYN